MVYGSGDQRGQLIGCANVEPFLVAETEIEIRFPRNGTNLEEFDRFHQSKSDHVTQCNACIVL